MVSSLLTAIVRADGDALVMHVGEKPYVVAPAGPTELSSRPLTLDAVSGMLTQLLPADTRRALDELGAIEHELPTTTGGNGDRFTVVAARGGDDIWIEVRRHRRAATLSQAPEVTERPERLPVPEAPAAPVVEPPEPPVADVGAPTSAATRDLAPPVEQAPLVAPPEPAYDVPLRNAAAPAVPDAPPAPAAAGPAGIGLNPPIPVHEPVFPAAVGRLPLAAPSEAVASAGTGQASAVVLPLARNPVRAEVQGRAASSPRIAGVERLLRLASARGANTLFLTSQSRPSVRVDGEVATLEGEPVLSAPEVESLLLDLAPERSREALRNGEGTEWMSEVPDVGRIRCQNFRDHRGPGGIFRIISARPTTAEQLGLSREIQALSAEPEGLILIAGPRASGKSTLISAFVDLINRTRNDYVVTIESQIKFAHESRGCLVSQREVRGDSDELAGVTRAALRENPDVIVIEDLRSPKITSLALGAVEAGHLVIGAISAHTASTAVERLIDQMPPERRQQVQLMLAQGLRGVVAQALLHKIAGGRVAARELLLNTPAIANLIAEGRISQLPLALDSGRKHGMVPLNDSLAAFVQSGVVDVREAYRKAFERQAFLAVLKREGVDTSFVERLA